MKSQIKNKKFQVSIVALLIPILNESSRYQFLLAFQEGKNDEQS